MRHRTLIFSDVHACSRHVLEAGHRWFPRLSTAAAQLGTTLEREVLSRPDSVRAVVLLGDTFDTGLSPMREEPPSYEAIIDDNRALFDRLCAIRDQGIRVIFARGNHDFDLDHRTVAHACPGAELCDDLLLGDQIYAAHGHAMTLFNSGALDPTGEGRPLGYFFARLGPGRLPGGHSASGIVSYLRRGVLSRLHRPDFLGRVLDVIFDIAGLERQATFVLEGGRERTASTIRELYATACATMSLRERVWRLIEENPRQLAGSVARARRQWKRGTVIFGHTHRASLRRWGSRLYANTGAWCEGALAHYVELMHGPNHTELMLREVDDQGRSHTRRQQRLVTQPTPGAELAELPRPQPLSLVAYLPT